ncbi:TetR family transcriptional regulator [Corynebacterium sp. 13CS0277]|uniref:TetR family transcriptional regulator n=1 Tax=Corynebacterium sp. 13CS0277 TaxID=2071994 RepID=UPI001304DAE4|nr:TetR family transcriptional regulator [Corynebacterium sp. 13CS0277]
MTPDALPLREAKRRATLAAIEDHATRLVEEHGFDAVTVEDICTAAGISKRTFFNYVDNKETAVLGPVPTLLDEDGTAAFVATTHTPLLPSLVDLVLDNFIAGHGNTSTTVWKRRKAILSSVPQLATARMKHFISAHLAYRHALDLYFQAHPNQRLLTDVSTSAEADTCMMLVTSCLELGLHRWAEGEDESDDSLRRACHACLGYLDTITSRGRT